MKIKNFIPLLVVPLLISCSGGEIDFDYAAKTLDVDNIDVGELHRDTLTGEIASKDGTTYFDFYEVSDFHGAVTYNAGETIGLAKMGDYFKKKRAENPGGTIVLSSGDMFQGSAESNLTHGYIVNYSMNIMGFEAMTLGNHEFDWTIDWLRKNQSLSVEDYKIPYLGANVFDKETGKLLDFLAPSTVITRGDYKVGIVGTLGDGADSSIMKTLVESLEFKPELPIVKAEAKRLKEEEKCDIVVWSSHRDVQELYQLGLAKSDCIDVVFGGHTHSNSPADGKAESTLTSDGIPFLETKNYGKGIAHARVGLDADKNIVSVVGETDIHPSEYPGLEDHPEVTKVMKVYEDQIDPIKSEVIGSTDKELEVSNTFTLTNYCVDTMMLVGKKWAKENGDVKILASFHNANGGVRSNIEAGDITYGSIYKSFPFDNEVVIIKATGKKLKSCFNQGNQGVWHDDSIKLLTDLDSMEEVYFVTTDFWALNAYKLKDKDLIRTNYIVRDVIAARIKSQGSVKAGDFDGSHSQYVVPDKR